MPKTLPKRSRPKGAGSTEAFGSSFGSSEDRPGDLDLKSIDAPEGRGALDERAIQTISAALRAGMPLQMTAGLVGVTQATLYRWVRKGQDVIDLREDGGEPDPKDLIYEKLTLAVDFGRSRQNLEGIEMLKIHALKNYQAQVALLKAQDPHTWAERSVSKVEVDDTRAPATDYSALSDEELELLASLQEKARAKALPGGG